MVENQNQASNTNENEPPQDEQMIVTGVADAEMVSTVPAQVSDTQAGPHSSVLEQLKREGEPYIPEQIKDTLFRDLWKLKILLQNAQMDTIRELSDRGLTVQALEKRDELVGPYPALQNEIRILEHVTHLWGQRDEIRTRFLKLFPYDVSFNPERVKDQVINLLQNYVSEHCNKYKKNENIDENEVANRDEAEQWDPVLTKDQALIFLQLAESLLRVNGGTNIMASQSMIALLKKNQEALFKGVLLFEDLEVLRCCLAIAPRREGPSERYQDDLPPHIYYPIAICPYKLFPGESKPISKLLAQELPLQLDVSHELESEENDPADGSKVKKTVTIPYSEFAQLDVTGGDSKRIVYNFLIGYLRERQEELKLPADLDKIPAVHALVFMIQTVRAFTDEAARQKGIQLWLQTMQFTRKAQISFLNQKVAGFTQKDYTEDVLNLVRVTNDERTCEQALGLLRSFVLDDAKFASLVGINSFQDELPEASGDQVPTFIQKSFAYKLTKQLLSMTMLVSGGEQGAQAEPASEQQEKSAFEVEMQDESAQKAVDPSTLVTTRVFPPEQADSDSVVNPDLLSRARVQVAVTRLLVAIFGYDKMQEANRLPPTHNRVIEGLQHIRRLASKLIGAELIHKHTDQIHLLKYHPFVLVHLIEPVYLDAYAQAQLPTFQQLEASLTAWIQSKQNKVTVLYQGEAVDQESCNTFELDTEYKALIVSKLLRQLSAASIGRERAGRARSATFPVRLADSGLLELLRTDLLTSQDPEIAEFVDRFTEDIIKLVVRAIDRDPALIRRLLRDRRVNQDPSEEENKEEQSAWDERGMIPLLLQRVRDRSNAHGQLYNIVLDLMRQICIVAEAKEFLEAHGRQTLEAIYQVKRELPLVYQQDQRIFWSVPALHADTFQQIQRNIPSILEVLTLHFNKTIDRIRDLTAELCQAQFTFINSQQNDHYSYHRKLRVRMEQTEQWEQLAYLASVVQGFTQSLNASAAEMLAKLVETPDRILAVLSIFENFSLFKNLNTFNNKLHALFYRLILCEQPSLDRHRAQDEQQQRQLEKFKALAARIQALTKGFTSYLGHPLERMPTYEQVLTEVSAFSDSEWQGGAECPLKGLTRNQTILWYYKTLTELTNKLSAVSSEQARRDIAHVDWEGAIKPQILFQRVMPERELEMFNELMLRTDSEFSEVFDKSANATPEKKKTIVTLRTAMKRTLIGKDFKALVTELAESRSQVDRSFKYLIEGHYEQYGLQISDAHWFTKLGRTVHGATMAAYRRQQPAQFQADIVRKNCREIGSAIALLAKHVKLGLPSFNISDEAILTKLLNTLSNNQVTFKPINRWARDLRGTVLIHFAALGGLRVLAQYHTVLQKLQLQVEEQLQGVSQDLSERGNVLVRLIVHQIHDSLTITTNLLTSCIKIGPQGPAVFGMADAAGDSVEPHLYTSIQHYFANHYNQLLTILAGWDSNDTDVAQLIQTDNKLAYVGGETVLMTLLKEMASNFTSCPMLKDGYAQEQPRHFPGRHAPARAQPVVEEPVRQPTPDELDMLISMGYDVERATAALQMANFDMSQALELIFSRPERQLLDFLAQQRAVRTAHEERQQKLEMEMALKLSMQAEADEGGEEEKAEEGDEALVSSAKLVDVPMIELQAFKDRALAALKKTAGSVMASIRACTFNAKLEPVLALLKVALVGQPTQGRHGEPGPVAKALLELTEEQQSEQREAIFASVNELVAVNLELPDAEAKIEASIQRFEFDVRLREMGYLQMMQNQKPITEQHEANAFLARLITAVSHLATLITDLMAKSTETFADEIKFYEDEETAQKVKTKTRLVELAVKAITVSVAALQLIHQIVIHVSREHEKAIRDTAAREEVAQAQREHAVRWIQSTQPNKLVQALGKLREATEVARKPAANGGKAEVTGLADQAQESLALIATHVLSLKQWHYLDPSGENSDDLDWYSAEWLKTTAQDFALSYVRLGKRNDKFLNQLLSLAIFEYGSLPQISQNLLNISLLYHTVYQTRASRREELKEGEDADADVHRLVLETFFEGELDASKSKVSYRNLFSLLKGLYEANPLGITANAKALSDCFQNSCAFEQAEQNSPRMDQRQIAFKKQKLADVQREAVDVSKALDARFASLDVTQTTRAELHTAGGAQPGEVDTGAAEEERKISNQSAFEMSEQVEVEKTVQPGAQAERVNQLIAQVKELSYRSEVYRKIKNEETKDPETKESTLRTQYNLLSKVAMFTQVYPDLTPIDDSFADWIVAHWFLQVTWAVAPEVKVLKGQAPKPAMLIPNSNIVSDLEKVERFLNRLTGLNRFQNLAQRTLRMNLRISFLERALVGLAEAQEALQGLCHATAQRPLTPEDLTAAQLARGQALSCLAVLHALISEETNAMKNRITVIPETFHKSVFYVLLRGRPGKDKSQAPVNLSKALSLVVKLSDRLLRRQSRMAAPPAVQEDAEQAISTALDNCHFFHGHVVSLSIGCLIDMCLFIERHGRGPKKASKSKKNSEVQDPAAARNAVAAVDGEAGQVDLPVVQLEEQEQQQQQILPVPEQLQQLQQAVDEVQAIVDENVEALEDQNEEMVDEQDDQEPGDDEDDDGHDDDNNDSDDDDDDDESSGGEDGNDGDLGVQYGDELPGMQPALDDEDDEDLYGDEMMDEEDLDDMLHHDVIERRFNVANAPGGRDGRQRDIVNVQRDQLGAHAPQPDIWDIGMQDPHARRRMEQAQPAFDETGWTTEENQIQRALQLLRGMRLHPTEVPQRMPGERRELPPWQQNVFMRDPELYPGRHADQALPDNNCSIRELTEVFKPLKTTEYLKSQAELSKTFNTQMKKALESLQKESLKGGEAGKKEIAVNLAQTIRSDSSPVSSEQRSRHAFLDQQRHHQVDMLNSIVAGREAGGDAMAHLEHIMERLRHHEENMMNIQMDMGDPIRFGDRRLGEPQANRGQEEGFGAGMAQMAQQIEREREPRRHEGPDAMMAEVMRQARGPEAEVFSGNNEQESERARARRSFGDNQPDAMADLLRMAMGRPPNEVPPNQVPPVPQRAEDQPLIPGAPQAVPVQNAQQPQMLDPAAFEGLDRIFEGLIQAQPQQPAQQPVPVPPEQQQPRPLVVGENDDYGDDDDQNEDEIAAAIALSMAEAEAAQVGVQPDGAVADVAAAEGEQNEVMASQSVPDESNNDAAAAGEEEAKAEGVAQPAEAVQTEEVVMASASEEQKASEAMEVEEAVEEVKSEIVIPDSAPIAAPVVQVQEEAKAAAGGEPAQEEMKSEDAAPVQQPQQQQPVQQPNQVVEDVQQEISAFQFDDDAQQPEGNAASADQQMADESAQQPAQADANVAADAAPAEEAKGEAAAPEEEKKDGEAAQAEEGKQPAEEAEPETLGYPNALLIANDIEPGILLELPEDIREAVLAPLQGQLRQHRAAEAQRQQQRQRAAAGQEEQKQGNNANADAQQPAQAPGAGGAGIEQDFLNALPEDLRAEVERNQAQVNAPAPELDFIAVIGMTEDAALRRDMLFQLNEVQIRQLPANLRREYDEAREEQARRIADAERERAAHARRAERRDHEFMRPGPGMHGHRYRDFRGGEDEDRKLDTIIEALEREVFERQEVPHFKAQAKFIERQLQAEDSLIETILRLVIQLAEEKTQSGDGNRSELSTVSREALENSQASEIVFLIHKLDDLRQAQSSGHTNRNKLSNAFAQLLAGEVEQSAGFRQLILEDEEEESKAEAMEVDEESKEEPPTMMIDTTQDGLKKRAQQQRSEEQKLEGQKKRSASLKLALMLIGTMRVVSKSFRVHLLKGLLLQEEYFEAKGASVIQKQSEFNAAHGKQLQPPLIVILQATDSVKRNLTQLETQLEQILPESENQADRKELQREVYQVRALLRNLNLLVLDIFKEFDQVIEKILSQQAENSDKDSQSQLMISSEALMSLTQLLSLPEVEKKQLQSLGRAFLLISKKNKQSWDLIHGEFTKIGSKSLEKINDKLTQITVRFQTMASLARMDSANSSKAKSAVMLEAENLQAAAQQNSVEEEKKEANVPAIALRTSMLSVDSGGLAVARQTSADKGEGMSQEDKAELAKMIVQDREALQTLKNMFVVYNYFSTEVQNEQSTAFKDQDERETTKAAIAGDLEQFYGAKKFAEHMSLLNDVLIILQGTKQIELTDELLRNISCIFEAHLPDLNEIIKKSKESGDASQQSEAERANRGEIKMRPIQQRENTGNPVLSLFKNVSVELPERLTVFSVFCLNNKKAINKLLQGRATLGLQLADIVKYMPNLLDFETKRAYFQKEIDKQRVAARGRGRLNIRVQRSNIFQSAYQELNYRSAAELKNKIKVTFEGEAGIDASGLTREFYTELSRAMFNPDYSLFNLTSNGASYYANGQSYINPDHTNFFKFIGRMVGKAIFDGQLLECFFARSLYKMMIGEELFFEDLSDMDNDCYRNLDWYLKNDVANLGQYFAVTREYFGRYEEIELVAGGSNSLVTNDNKASYVEKFTFHKMYLSVKEQIDAFLGGFHDIVSRDLISIFNAKELELLISGLPNFDVVDLKANTQLRGYTMDSPQIIWLFEILESYDKHEQALFLQFVTGSSKIPLEGFKALQGMDGVDPFKVHRVRERDQQALPKSHTCFNTLDLPEYPVKELMHERLLFAIRETSGFGLA